MGRGDYTQSQQNIVTTVENVKRQKKATYSYLFVCDCHLYSWSHHTEQCDLPPQTAFGTVQGWGLPQPPLFPASTLPNLEKKSKIQVFRIFCHSS